MSLPLPTLSPSEISYIQTSLSDPIHPTRSDSRSLLDTRPIEVSYGVFPHANGSSRIKIGGTEVVAGIKLEVVDSSESSKGWKGKVEVDITPQAFPASQPSNLSSTSAYLSSILQSHFIPSIPPLVIIPNQKYFQPQLHLTLISSDGNVLSALVLGARSAFADLKLPKIKIISWVGENGENEGEGAEGVIGKGDLSGIKAAIKSKSKKGRNITKGGEDWDLDLSEDLDHIDGREELPVLVTLNLVPNSPNIFLDATSQEESACPSKLHLFFTTSSTEKSLKVCGIRFEGGQSIDNSRIKGLIEEGARIAGELISGLNGNLPQ
ncbi:hypothetical protein I203_100181 [Kwoniella mangroviensis CBS 8507]|uniref:uncharacterized protein n=1 Tax=Kwoniella mangroviensis CBS 8507 TaxID=1296122 RepID=UPI00080D53E7|nr:uncharacterized protein I203_08088 [Kwoniella mangroviensis CBS 8507]OCF62864.1 hypothetical protein I203_08088 [Kwoniella mangroviensis CBS 8507]